MQIQTIDVYEAQNRLLDLLGSVTAGGEVMLTKGDQPIARLVPIKPAATPRVAGLHMGAISVSNDFDESLPDGFWLGEV
jgi:antitoxin (DNA-binding transcriptional repressor) of toxin-antitoxin stability system